MPGSGAGEKTERATPKKRRDERKKGNVFSSKDLVAALFLLIVFLVLKALAPLMYVTFSNSMKTWLSLCDGSFKLTDSGMKSIFIDIVKTTLIIAGPVMAVAVLSNIIFTGAQTRFIFSGEALKPKFSRINPIEGIKRLFSLHSLVEVAKSLIKIAVISAIIYDHIKNSLRTIAKLFDVDLLSSVAYIASEIFSTVMIIAIFFVGLGVFDFLYQWWEYEKNLRMTKQEVKEEFKQTEGDPQIKGKIRQKQQEMSRRRMMQQVPNADVVIRNPTHYAVAILYDPDKNNAPVVIAKGMDYVALKIIDIAKEHGVTLTENKPLARALYEEVDLGREIPPTFYQEVAEILAWVYDLKNKKLPV